MFFIVSSSFDAYRYLTATAGKKIEDDRRLLMLTFSKLERDDRGMLYFSNAHSEPDDQTRRNADRHRKAYLQQTGRYYSDMYEDYGDHRIKPKSGISKKPKFGIIEGERLARSREEEHRTYF
jgi:hypothetical protein